jgi:hypothetical protein
LKVEIEGAFLDAGLVTLDQVGLQRRHVHGSQRRVQRRVSSGDVDPARDDDRPILMVPLHYAGKLQAGLVRQRRNHHVAHRCLDLLEADLQRRPRDGGV